MKKILTLALMLLAFSGMSMAATTYTVAGSQNVLGSNWDVTDTNNDMTLLRDGIYTLTKQNVSLSAGETFEFKVCGDHAWTNGEWGATDKNNAYYKVNKSGTYDVTFIFALNGYNGQNAYVGCIVKGDDMKLLVGSNNTWTVADNAVTYADGAYKVDFTGTPGTMFVLAPAADVTDGISGDEWNRVVRPTTTNYYDIYLQHAADNAVPIKTEKVWYVSEAGNYSFSYYPNACSFTVDGSATVNIGSTGWATYSTGNYEGSNGYTITGASAFYVSGTADGKAQFTPIAEGAVIPTKAGVIVKGSSFTVNTTSETGSLSGNLLVGSGSNSVTVPSTGYILANGGDGLGFYPIDDTDNTLAAHKAYLDVPGGARSFIAFDNEATSIHTIAAQQENGEIYNLSGQRVVQPQKGLYIVGGKKKMMK